MLTPIQKVAIGGALVAVVLLAAYWTVLFVAQRSMLFPMPPVAGAPPRPAFAEQIWLSTSFGRVEAWYLPAIRSARAVAAAGVRARQRRVDRLLAGGIRRAAPLGRRRAARRVSRIRPLDGSPSQTSITEGMLAGVRLGTAARRSTRHGSSLTAARSVAGPRWLLSVARAVPAVILESSFSSVAHSRRALARRGFLFATRSTTCRRSSRSGDRS